jgi:hypothetical protein
LDATITPYPDKFCVKESNLLFPLQRGSAIRRESCRS